MSSIDPQAKRQRKEPSWRVGFVDPNNTLDDDPITQQLLALQQLSQKQQAQAQGQRQQQQQQQATSSEPSSSGSSDEESDPESHEDPPRVLDVRPVDANKVEVVVERGGRRYRGVMERKELPPGVGVPIPLTPEELASITAASGHGESSSSSSLCALCNTKLNATPVVGMSDDKVGAYVKVRVTSNWTARVHLQCAAWCPEVMEDPCHLGYYHHMGTAVRRGRQLRCHVCKERGATVGCFQEGCPSVYHLTCAVDAGCSFDEETQEVWCPEHIH
ncbi:hypothetical protein HYH02_000235 [Chlamydomonas schloesseri]|uniref:PHD-type domain-containing protein n=1 Tax=Chlamydomonas schloesseri TaxID=2026947 RepID=A0A835WM31_9CHLO|nr:hypothetical protein HYH02_000235 [Chlamydomonas schloesseri]|eukprot:KAG2450132.1 hypothetical protein HYH02_000235 [Chlamydomonas schloesseri]